ncbi:hypothetical protein ACHQM5_000472 [Ranunculus cassubicifolius]
MNSQTLPTFQLLSFPHQKPKPQSPTFHHPTNFNHQIIIITSPTTSNLNKSPISTKNTKNCINSTSNDLETLKTKQWIHFIGIGGCGLSALAMLAFKQGCEVSGSDIAWNGYMDELREAGAQLYVGHSISNIQRKKNTGSCLPDAVVVSSAIPGDNVEVLHARAMGVPVYKRDGWLEMATKHYNLIAVSGTHGKSTTASMLAYVLRAMGDDLTAIIGAHVPQFPGGNILCGSSPNFVLEADEYDGCFLKLSPYIAVVTNVELEHVDIFQDEDAVKNSFRQFINQIRGGGHLILCGDSEGAYSLLNYTRVRTDYRVTTYGISNVNEWYASSVCPNSQGGTDFVLYHMGREIADISLQLSGTHNVLNSLAVIATISALANDLLPIKKLINYIKLQLKNFLGVSRRFEMIGSINRCHIFDDYAHHPTEVRAVIQAARQRFPLKSLLVVFQPHTFSRLATFIKEFSNALGDADRVIITKVYASRERNTWDVSGKDLSMSIIGPPSEYIPSLIDVVDKLAFEISNSPDRELVILTLGAGDVTNVGRKLLQKVEQIYSVCC